MELKLSPGGQVFLSQSGRNKTAKNKKVFKTINDFFNRSQGDGLLALAFLKSEKSLPPSIVFFKAFGDKFLASVRQIEEIEDHRKKLKIDFEAEYCEELIAKAPPFPGGEYLSRNIFQNLWAKMNEALTRALSEYQGTVKDYFRSRNPSWHLVDKICFNLAENRNNPNIPFAFMATYISGLSSTGNPGHKPLKMALHEFAGTKNKKKLLELLEPIYCAGEKSSFLKNLLDSKRIFHPLALSADDAYKFLKDVQHYEEAGIFCRVPDWWRNRSKNRLKIIAKIGDKASGILNTNSLLDFSVDLMVGDNPISEQEWQQIRSKTEGLAMIRGCWVELDTKKLDQMLKHWQQLSNSAKAQGVTLVEAMRMLAGMPDNRLLQVNEETRTWSKVIPGNSLKKTLAKLRQPENIKHLLPESSRLKCILRSYQVSGVKWLGFMNQIGLGACLADDMGLGKTVQVLAFLITAKNKSKAPSLLIVPASLIGNWESEILRFTPSLRYRIQHPSVAKAGKKNTDTREVDLVITTYGYLSRCKVFQKQNWSNLILDEAQAIKNPSTRQTVTVKSLKSRNRIALTGTPVENRLADLWSIFDFLNPGLLGTAIDFKRFSKSMSKTSDYSPLRKLVQPYILRRLKTDKNIISDLPDKTEIKCQCKLSREQTVIYDESIKSLKSELESVETGIKRKGVVLSYLQRFKQICNHPSQWLRDQAYVPEHSGKFIRLQEICEEISSKNEKVIIFTQFREITKPLLSFCQTIFGTPGLLLDGQTPVKKRQEQVRQFQNEPDYQFFILSLKAGGTGLNLTSASHVVHFDRWWNPAVENQATDRAFRIGQKKNVLVHKFFCPGTLEEKIDSLIEAKTKVAAEILSDSAASVLASEMSDRELLDFVSLDLAKCFIPE